MRTLPLLLTLLFTACAVGAPPAQEPDSGAPVVDAGPAPTPDAGPQYELMSWARTETRTSLFSYPTLDAGVASTTTQLTYALGADYPSAVTVEPGSGYALGESCGSFTYGRITWSSILSVEGSAARVELAGGALALSLREEGDLAVLLEGTLGEQRCERPDGTVQTMTLPLRHRLEVKVRRVAGFAVSHLNQTSSSPAGCAQRLVLPEGTALWLPTVSAVDATGATFEALNAPAPATLILRSSAPLEPMTTRQDLLSLQFIAGAGHVSVALETALPVRGLTGLDVVGATSLTAVELAFLLVKESSKCSTADALEEGGTYKLWYPELRNAVELRIKSATTTLGPLCDAVPSAWFSAQSSTPAQCAALSPVTEQPTNCVISGPTVASIASPGECRLELSVPGTALRWGTRFTVTP